jgi:hypothetical protein
MTACAGARPFSAPSVSSTAVEKTSVVARRPPQSRSSSASSLQLRWRETNLPHRVAAIAAKVRARVPGGRVGSMCRTVATIVTYSSIAMTRSPLRTESDLGRRRQRVASRRRADEGGGLESHGYGVDGVQRRPRARRSVATVAAPARPLGPPAGPPARPRAALAGRPASRPGAAGSPRPGRRRAPGAAGMSSRRIARHPPGRPRRRDRPERARPVLGRPARQPIAPRMHPPRECAATDSRAVPWPRPRSPLRRSRGPPGGPFPGDLTGGGPRT